MVFEGILVDVLNRFLGPYVKNLDASQLKVGIWGGDVLLEKLDLKENALDDFNLPIRIFGGHLDKLRMKIPWKNLYSAPVVAEVDGLYIIAGPSSAAKYDASRDAKERKDNKERQLKKIADARKKILESKEKKDEAPGFVEKLVTQIIKNVQVTVRNIHITYEDQVTDPSNPFSVGVTLDSLFVQSTDSNYVVDGPDADPTSQLIFKLIHMSCLSVYWNTDANLIGSNDLPEDWADILKQRIARPDHTPSDMQYLLHPISAEAKLQLTMKPGSDSNIPKALASLVLEHISVSVGKKQYRNIVGLVESFDRMVINQKYLKYKPSVPVKEDPKDWWRYAITAVLEEDVKRRTQMWSWKHIKQHRAWCSEYTELYLEKLMAKKMSADLKNQLEELEVHLDVLNITLCRQLAENKAERRRSVEQQERAESGGGGWWAWSTNWITGSSGDGSAERAMATPPSKEELSREKEKMYKALDYSEDAQVATFPKEYVAYKVTVQLGKVSVGLYNEEGPVSELLAHKVGVDFSQRPAAKNISVSASLGSLKMSGRSNGVGEAPVIVSTKHDKDALLEVGFELNPLASKADYSISAQLQPVQIVYDAETIDAVIGMFLLPKDVQLQKLSAAASSTIEEVKTQGRAGLEHSIGQKKVMDVNILVHSPYIVVPENGTLTESSTVLLLDLGSLHVFSDASHKLTSVRDASMEQLQKAFYDYFSVQLKDVQVIVAKEGDDWEAARRDHSSPLHILQPTRIDLRLDKSLMDDARLPKIKMSGELPSLSLSLSDKKLKQVLRIVQSLPLPPPSLASKPEASTYSYELVEPTVLGTDGILHTLSATLLDESKEEDGDDDGDSDVWYSAEEGEIDEQTGLLSPKSKGRETEDGKEKENMSVTKLVLTFDIHEISVNFSEHNESTKQDVPRLDLLVSSVSTCVKQRMWDLGVSASVGSLAINDYYTCVKKEVVGVAGGVVVVVEGEPERLLSTEISGDMGKQQLLSIEYNKNDKESPQYPTEVPPLQSIDVSLSLLKLRIHRESLTHLLAISKSISAELKSKDEETKDKDKDKTELIKKSISKMAASQSKPLETEPEDKSVAKVTVPGEKDLHVKAKLTGVEVTLCDHHGDLLTANVKGLTTTVDIDKKSISIEASLSDVTLIDADPGSCHPNVISRMDESQEVISTTVKLFKNPSKADLKEVDLSVNAQVQRLKVTVIFRFLDRVKDFVSQFLLQLKLDQKTIDSAKEAAAKTASRTADALKEQSSSRVLLNVTIFAPVVIVPLSCLSQSALVADLGTLEVKNEFLFASELADSKGLSQESFITSTGQKTIVDSMDISISSIQLGRVENLKEEGHVPSAHDHMILKPLKFRGVVVRSLSSWCKAVDVHANLKTLEVQFSPDDFQAVMSVLNSLNDGVVSNEADKEFIQKQIEPTPSETDSQTEKEEGRDESERETEKESEVTSNVRVKAAVGVVKLLLHSSAGELASISVEELTTGVDVHSEAIQVSVGITGVNVCDLSSKTRFPEIVSVTKGSKALEAKIGVYPNATKSEEGYLDMSKCDLSVDASVGQLRLVLLFLFVNKLTSYLKQFEVSQRAIDRAKRSAQESASAAVTAVQEQHKSGQRMKLRVSLKAPEIVIPLHSDATEVIVADLGVLELKNTFKCVATGNSVEGCGTTGGQQHPPIFEEYNIQLNDLQVCRTILKEENSTDQPRSLILEPFNLKVEMKRNLSSSWYTDEPTISLDAKLGNLKMAASGADIEAVCSVISGNLREGTRAITPTANIEGSKHVDAVEEQDQKGSDTKSTSEEDVADEVSSGSEAPRGGKVFKTLVLSAELTSMEIELFKMEPNTNGWKRSPRDSLASLILHQFEASVGVESNSAMKVNVSLVNCLLDDKRSKKNRKMMRLVEKVSGVNSTLISMDLDKTSSGDSEVICNVESVQVLLDLVFILLLVDFLKSSVSSLAESAEPIADGDRAHTPTMETENQPPVSLRPGVDSSVTTLTDATDDELTPSSSAKKEVVASKKMEEDGKAGKMTIEVNVSRPVIALVENSEKDNSRALVFGTEVSFSMEQTADKMELTTSISDLSIFATRVQNLQNRSTKVLEPSKEPIKASLKSTKDLSTHINVAVPSIALTLSPTTVRLILHVIQSIQLTDEGEEKEIGETSPFDLWDPKPVDTNSWYLTPPEDSEKNEGTSVDVVPPARGEVFEKDEKLVLSLDGLTVLIEQDLPSGGCSAPVVAVTMGKHDNKALTLTVGNWSGLLNVESELSLEASYYNLGRDAWEPLLEPVVDPTNEDQYMPWSLKAYVYKNDLSGQLTSDRSSSRSSSTSSSIIGSKQDGSKQDYVPPEIAVEVVSESPLNLTVTKTSLGLFKDLWTTYQEEGVLEGVEETDSCIPETLEAAFLLKNELGQSHPLTVTTRDTLKAHGAYSSTLRHGSTVPLHPVSEVPVLKPGEYLPRETYKKRRVHIVALEVQGFKPIDVALGTSDRVYYSLTPAQTSTPKKSKDKDVANYGLVVDITRHAGRRVPLVTIRSPLQIVNNLNETVKVYWTEDPSSNDPLPQTPITTLTRGSTHALALETTGRSTGGFYLQPDVQDLRHSKQALMWRSKEKNVDLECYAVRRSIQGSSRCKPFFLHVTIDEERYTKKSSIQLDSRAHHIFILKYPLTLQSLIPLSVSVTENSGAVETKELKSGQQTFYSHVTLAKELRLCTKVDYNGKMWSGEITIGQRSSEYSTFSLKCETPTYSVDDEEPDGEDEEDGSEPGSLEFTVHKEDLGTWHLTLYCPYWIVNKTGLTLEYAGKNTDVITIHHQKIPIALYPYREVRVRVVGPSHQHSEWSKTFSLDAVGSEGIFQCIDKNTNHEYQMGTKVVTSSVGLSKVITLSPLFLAYNQTRDDITFNVKSDSQEQTHTVRSKQLLPFWPPSGTNRMCLSVNDSEMINPSDSFSFTENASLLVKTRGEIPAVVTEVQVTGSANIIMFNPYFEGAVPIKLVNHTDYDIQFQQTSESGQPPYALSAGQCVLYTWDNPILTKAIDWRLVAPARPLKMKSIEPKDGDGKFVIPRKMLPRSSSATSITSSLGGGNSPRSSISDWSESGEGVDYDEWDDLVEGEVPGDSLYGIEETSEDPGWENEEFQEETDSGFSVTEGFKKFGKSIRKLARTSLGGNRKRGTVGYWISFLDGLQRVILFTTSEEVCHYVIGGSKTERASTDVSLSLEEVGLSLVNDHKGLEVAYIGIPPSKPIWQTLKRWNRWKPVSNELKKQLEDVLDKLEKREGVVDVPGTNFKIDFSNEDGLMLIEKNGTKKRLRRSKFQGVFVQLSLSEHLTSVEARINAVQIDNHLPFTCNPTILYDYPTPPTVASKFEPKPFIEGSLIMRKTEQSNVKQIQLLQVLVQEIGLNVDINFLLAITGLLDHLPRGQTEAELIETDVALSKLPLKKSKVEQVSAAAARNYFKQLHLSPLDIHLSFYLDRDSSYKDDPKEASRNPVIGAVLNAFTQFGVIIGRTKDAELQLGYFELDNVALTQSALMNRIQKHYIQQAALQMYSIVLGLEVLGNPVGFIKGLKDGTIGLFYHPIQGAVLGPGEFFEGLALGGREFFSGTLGGLSGAVGKVSGVLGDAAAKLTMDEEYQEKRRRRTGGSDSVRRGMEGAAKGVLAGFTGVVTQPYKGAKKEGAWGAFKGLGKGVIGVILRPTAGLLDLTSATFNVVQKKTKVGDSELAQIRAARHIGPDMIVYPYSRHRSAGYALFMDVDNGRLVDSDTFYDHVELIAEPLKVLLVTNRQLAVVKHNSLVNRFDDDFTVKFEEFTGPARIDEKQPNVIIMPVKEEAFSLGFISGKKSYKDTERTLTVLKSDIAKKSVDLINQAYEEFKTTSSMTEQ